MTVIIYNLFWMTWNLILAAVSVVLSWYLTRKHKQSMRLFWGFLWLIFAPNTIYVLTDLYHLVEQWGMVGGIEKLIVLCQYFIFISIGVVTFVMSLYFFEYSLTRYLPRKISEYMITPIIAVLNFVIAFGVMVGRVQRTNSWELFTNPTQAYHDIVQTLTSPTLLIFVFVFGTIGNIIYFSIRDIYKQPFSLLKKHLAFFHV